MIVNLSKVLEKRLDELAAKTEKSKDQCLQEALQSYLEDREDYLAAWEVKKRLLSGEETTSSFEEVMKRCGLAFS